MIVFVCSSRAEGEYYKNVFGWDKDKVKYVPYHTDPGLLNYVSDNCDNYILSAGRTFRDYNTLFKAVSGSDMKTVVVASPSSIDINQVPNNVEIKYDIEFTELAELMRRSRLIVLPLDNKNISTGQSVLLQSMAIGKAVIITKTNGTIDYIEHMVNGVLVEPNNPEELKYAIDMLNKNDNLRKKIEINAKNTIENKHLPQHYFDSLSNIIRKNV